MEWKAQLRSIVKKQAGEVIALRRHFHANPEPSGEELQTSLHLYQQLDKLGLDVRMGPEGCGVVAENSHAEDAKIVAVRGDIDALRIQDAKDVSYRSTVDGIMHACGHDAHSAIVFGVAKALTELIQQEASPWPIAFRTIFQPAEETATGAAQMIEAGVLEGVDKIFALHVAPPRRTGEIGIRSGAMTAHCDSLQIVVKGRGGHAARPHESKDPIAASALLISSLYQFIPRATDSHDAVVLTFGRITGGENPNVIPDTVELWGTMRTLDATVRRDTIEQIRQTADGVAEITGTKIEVSFHVSIPSVYNDADLTRLVWEQAEEIVGEEHVVLIGRPSMGSEDFACYLENVPGVMFRLGCSDDLASVKPLHTPEFDIDESALEIGVNILAQSVIMACCPEETR